MKLTKRQMVLVSFMLFSLFFGAGNLIFPPFLGHMAGDNTPLALAGFLVTAVVLPVMGVLAVAEYDGLDKLAGRVGRRSALAFTIIIYLSIGPGLGIPRAASVPFEMAISPLLPEGSSLGVGMLIYSTVFFLLAGWLALTPNKLVDRIGKVMSPCLLLMLTTVFVSFLFAGKVDVAAAQGAYQDRALVTGFLEGYNTMDAIAALNFGLVIATTLRSFKVEKKEDIMSYTLKAGIAAGTILALVYVMLSFIGMRSSAVYPVKGNGAWTLRCVVDQLFGFPGGVLLAVIFTLACLTTCVGLITSISQYFSTLTKKLSYRQWAVGITLFSFAVCNQGLNNILSISVPVLNAVYPVAIVLIVLGLCDRWLKNNNIVFPWTVGAVAVVSIVYSLDKLEVPLGFVKDIFSVLPFYKDGMGWVTVAVVVAAVTIVVDTVKSRSAEVRYN